MKKFICAIVIVAAMVPSAWAQASTPLQTVEKNVKQLLAVLGDQTLTGPAGEQKKKAAIESIAGDLFDFTELSRFALGANWRRFSPEQQKTFVGLYRQLLQSIYMGRLLQYKDEKVVFKSEADLSPTRSEVLTDIVASGGNIPIDYRMVKKDGVWKVYDLIIEHASLASNYRAQFNSILDKNSPDKLLDMLRAKVKEEASSASSS